MNRNTQTAANKKPAGSGDSKKPAAEENEESGGGTAGGSNATTNKDEDDIYEFKGTPKEFSSSGDDKSDTGKSSDKSSDEKSGGESDGPQPAAASSSVAKRTFADVEGAEEVSSVVATPAEEDTKRKKRKEGDASAKEPSGKSATGVRIPLRQEKGSKIPGPASKTIGVANKAAAASQADRKSPCASPKPAKPTTTATDSDAESEESKGAEGGFSSTGGPKVPPLKIVIPQQNAGGGEETGASRNGKNASTRNHQALPYVVASSNSNDSTADKESSSSRCASPTDGSGKSGEDKKTSDERAQQRVLRSSHRSGGQSGSSSVDRSSNNSSPQLQSSASPSPAPPSSDTTSTGAANAGNATSGTGSPATAASSAAQSSAGAGGSTGEAENTTNAPSPATSSASSSTSGAAVPTANELHPRKRKIKASKEQAAPVAGSSNPAPTPAAEEKEKPPPEPEVHPHDQPFTNCYTMFLNIRKQIERRQRGLFPVQPKPPQGFKDYLLNRRTYVLAGKTPPFQEPSVTVPAVVPAAMRELFLAQEKERHKLKMQHIVEKEKLVLAVEQEILRVHGRAARALANQSLPFSVCTLLKDAEVYTMITPEQEDRNARSRYNGRLFLSWLQDVDDKWEKIKEAMLLRHHNEAESLHAVQKMDWEFKMKDLSLCEFKAKPTIDEQQVPQVLVSDDFDLLPA